MGQKQGYSSFRLSLAAGDTKSIPVYGRWVEVLDNSIASNPHISIDGSSFYEIPAGVAIRPVEPFRRLEFNNPAASAMALWIGVSDGEIYDARSVIAASSGSAVLPVIDVSNTITTYASIVALPRTFLIDNAAAVNKGGGKVGIPVTSNPFATGEILTITGTVNYNGGAHVVDATSGANEVVITAAYVAETFDGVNDRIGLTVPRSRAADATRKELIVFNTHATLDANWGDANISSDTTPGSPIQPRTTFIIPTTAQVCFTADENVGKSGSTLHILALRNT